jgi:phosphomevalonate kinase
MTLSTTSTVSAPGKVLLAGGYLVLESPNVGLVLAADKRFYCSITSNNNNNNNNNNNQYCLLTVDSPQFHSTWKYDLILDNGVSLNPSPTNRSTNTFIEKTLRVVCAYLFIHHIEFPAELYLSIRADNDFYSVVPHVRLNRTLTAVRSLPKFMPCPTDDDGNAIVHKTGLGSSAALVAALVGACYHHLPPPNEDNDNDYDNNEKRKTRVDHLAQLSHCHAQGKVGSGFDVSSAIYGSHVYQRFPPSLLTHMLTKLDEKINSTSNHVTEDTCQSLRHIIDKPWSGGLVTKIELPKGMHLLLADVCGGSESPSMASQVLQWKSIQHGTQYNYWDQLATLNPTIIELLQRLTIEDQDLTMCKETRAQDWKDTHPTLYQLHQALTQSRVLLKAMGDTAGVPIEPPPQTALADATMELPGVVAAVVPGAGGYDALACLYIDGVQEDIGRLWNTWTSATICPLAVEAAGVNEGLRVEYDFPI